MNVSVQSPAAGSRPSRYRRSPGQSPSRCSSARRRARATWWTNSTAKSVWAAVRTRRTPAANRGCGPRLYSSANWRVPWFDPARRANKSVRNPTDGADRTPCAWAPPRRCHRGGYCGASWRTNCRGYWGSVCLRRPSIRVWRHEAAWLRRGNRRRVNHVRESRGLGLH
jgi:hypothetical protein